MAELAPATMESFVFDNLSADDITGIAGEDKATWETMQSQFFEGVQTALGTMKATVAQMLGEHKKGRDDMAEKTSKKRRLAEAESMSPPAPANTASGGTAAPAEPVGTAPPQNAAQQAGETAATAATAKEKESPEEEAEKDEAKMEVDRVLNEAMNAVKEAGITKPKNSDCG